ncbi:Spore coat protein SA [bacterium HR37]|nr:Spore coat protein SA [bacterium HR37]
MKHCCIITTVHSPFDVRIFHKQARSLVKAGYRVTLIAPHDRCEVVEGIKIISLPRSRNRIARMLTIFVACKLALYQRADTYHFHDPELIFTGLILKLLGKKVIYDVHEDYPRQVIMKDWIPALLRRPVSIFISIIEYIVGRIFDGVVVATDFIAERFPASKTVIVRNFPSIEYFKEPMDCSRKYLERPIAIYAGGLTRLRGIRQIVEAFSLLKEIELWLVGKFEDHAFRNEIVLKATPNVKILGFKPFEEVVQLYKKSSIGLVCLLPTANYLESLPIKLFEYMAAGLPVVASNFPLWAEFVEGCGVLVNPEDPQDIANGVRKILSNPETLQKMGETGRRKFLETYNWEQEFPKLLELYARLL